MLNPSNQGVLYTAYASGVQSAYSVEVALPAGAKTYYVSVFVDAYPCSMGVSILAGLEDATPTTGAYSGLPGILGGVFAVASVVVLLAGVIRYRATRIRRMDAEANYLTKLKVVRSS